MLYKKQWKNSFQRKKKKQKGKVVALYEYDGLGKNPIQEASAGEIVALSGMSDITKWSVLKWNWLHSL